MGQKNIIFSSVLFVLNYIYKTLIAIPQDLLTEIHLSFYKYTDNKNKKILGYWDFNQRLAKTGDFIVFLEILSLLRTEFGLDQRQKNIDICFIDDPTHHNAQFSPYIKSYKFKKDLKSLLVVNPFLDTTAIFKSNEEFEQFYKQNKKRYIRWPPTVAGSIPSDCRIIEKYFAKFGTIPFLSIESDVLKIIYEFHKNEVYPARPVVLNIRNNPSHSTKRNSNIKEIKKFIQNYERNQNYKFIIICNKEEFPIEFQGLINVIFSKDYFSGIEFDIALIKTSYISIFPDSGMAIFAYFSDTPFIQYGEAASKKLDRHMTPLNDTTFNFFAKYQRRHYKKEEAQLLIKEFEDLSAQLELKHKNFL